MDIWKVCWKINLCFQTKLQSQHTCIACGKVEVKGRYLSSFVHHAVFCEKRHRWTSFGKTVWHSQKCICNTCDREMLMHITMRKQTCFAEGCESILNIDERAVKEGVKDKILLESYLEIVERYRVFTCVICFCEESLSDAIEHLPTSNCKHDVNVSKYCMENLLKSAVEGGGWQDIRCPDASCKEALTGSDVQTFATQEVFKHYEEIVSKKNLSAIPNFRWCAGDHHKCGSGQIISTEEDDPKWKCKKCDTSNCFNCLSIYHDGQTCSEYQRDAKVDAETLALIYISTKKCPNRTCKRRITKDEMCKDMRCKKEVGGCGIEFCWNCKIIYTGLSSHLESCTFRGSRVVARPDEGDERYAEGWDKDPNYVPGEHEYRMFRRTIALDRDWDRDRDRDRDRVYRRRR